MLPVKFSNDVATRCLYAFRLTGLLLVLLSAFSFAHAQSIDANAPTPVSSNDLSGTITARDLGDARLTRYYYAFGGNPGDVLITIQSTNLNGDIDVFTAGTLRPLLKFTLYAESASPSTKGIYLRRHEDLILRVEARTPNDDEGSFRIRFGGSFEPLAAPLIAEAEKTEPAPRGVESRNRSSRFFGRCTHQRAAAASRGSGGGNSRADSIARSDS